MIDSKPKRIGIAIEMGTPFWHHHGCYKGIVSYLQEHHPDWVTVVDPYMQGLTGDAIGGRYDGIVGRITAQAGAQAKTLGVPAVNHWANSPAADIPCVFTDYRACGQMAGRHFIEHGYRRIGMITWPTDKARPLYFAGLQEVASENRIEVSTLDVPYSFEADPESFVVFYNQLREALLGLKPPIGLYVPMDAMALYVIQVCRELGLRIPNDIGLAVAYNSLEICLNTRPTLTSIQTNDEKVGYEAMRMLDRALSGEPVASDERLLVPPTTLRIRGSSDLYVSEDKVVSKAMRYIVENAKQMVGVEDVAVAVGVSTRTLSRRFKQHVGQSVLHEINNSRLRAVGQMLLDTDLSIGDVSAACGFSTTSHFNVFFRKMTDQTPGEYRKQHRTG